MPINLHNAEFLKSAAGKDGFIRDDLPKVAFAGRSNVGKSSTINAILNRKALARVSESPGKTAHVNYFCIDKKAYLVDLPGYGFARVSMKERERWGRMMEDYFNDRAAGPKLCVLLVDSRHAPTADDVQMCNYFRQCGYQFLVAANKADGIKKSQREASIAQIRETLTLDETDRVILYSAKKKENIEELRDAVIAAWEE